MDISIVIPVKDEEECIIDLLEEIKAINLNPEIIVIDDGSTDNTYSLLEEYQKQNTHVKVIKFRRNFGQTAATSAGFKHATGDIIVCMDGDGQNDPNDIPKLIAKLNQNYDCVSGWRKDRKDSFSKKLLSKFANILGQTILKVPIHDAGCSLKAYKKECVQGLELYGEMHRFIVAILFQKGFRIGEEVVNHRPRTRGKTKYGFKRVLKGFLDLIYLRFWETYSTRPLHFFGLLGVLLYALSGLIFIQQIIKAFLIRALHLGPLLEIGILFVVLGTVFVCFGFLAETISRTYYKDKESYEIEVRK